jgi:stalled ribosome alternative rescue factor ArfA
VRKLCLLVVSSFLPRVPHTKGYGSYNSANKHNWQYDSNNFADWIVFTCNFAKDHSVQVCVCVCVSVNIYS